MPSATNLQEFGFQTGRNGRGRRRRTEKVTASEGDRGDDTGELNLHARRVIWHRHGILGEWRLGGKYERSAV